MKKNEIEIGGVYIAKVSGHLVPVKIDRENPRGGWEATNLKTRKSVRVKSAQRLRRKASDSPAKRIVTKAEYEAEAKREADVAGAGGKKPGGAITEANKADAVNAAMQAVAADKKKRSSGLDAAAAVLAKAKEPLNTREMVERMLAKGLWQTKGATPAATIYAAIIREIAVKGKEARFRKVERGKFELNR